MTLEKTTSISHPPYEETTRWKSFWKSGRMALISLYGRPPFWRRILWFWHSSWHITWVHIHYMHTYVPFHRLNRTSMKQRHIAASYVCIMPSVCMLQLKFLDPRAFIFTLCGLYRPYLNYFRWVFAKDKRLIFV